MGLHGLLPLPFNKQVNILIECSSLFYPEDGGSRLFQNAENDIPEYTTLHPKGQ
jgi:hypothetical protein